MSGRPTIWIIVGQESTALAVGAGGGCLDIFTLLCPFSVSQGVGAIYIEILSERSAKHKTTTQREGEKMYKQPQPHPLQVQQALSWLVGCFGLNGPFTQYFSLYRAVSQTGRKMREMTDERKISKQTPTRTSCKRNRPLPFYNPK